MRRLHLVYGVVLALLWGGAAPLVAAVPECTDLLPAKPGLSSEQISENRFLRTIAFAHLKTAAFRDRNNKKVLGGSFPAGDAVLGRDFPAGDYAAFQRSLARFDFSAFADEVAVALSSGDKRITKAWQDCMTTRTGLMMWFTPSIADPTEAVLNLRWSAAGPHAPREIELTETLELPPDIKVTQGKRCLQRGNAITRAGCAATLKAKSAKTVFTAGVNSEDGWVQAYWPERMRLEIQRKPYKATWLVTPNQSYTHDNIGEADRTDSFLIKDDVGNDGWQFAPSTLRLWQTARSGKEFGSCKQGRAYVDDDGAIQVSFNAENLSAKTPQALVCAWYATTKVLRIVDRDAKR